MSTFNIKVNRADIDDVKRVFAAMPEIADKVIVRSINLTLAGVKTDASSQIRTIITASKSRVDEHMSTIKADAMKMTGQVNTVGGPLGFIDFKTSQTKAGTNVQIYKSRAKVMWTSAFIATMKSGHKAVLKRAYKGVATGKYVKKAWSKMPKKFRLPIHELFGPRIPSILEHENVMPVVLSKAGDRVITNLDHETNFELSKL